ncbi:hypothetical protein [Georgenia sp. SUBG003]
MSEQTPEQDESTQHLKEDAPGTSKDQQQTGDAPVDSPEQEGEERFDAG